ncbi:hypothetical protein H0O01_02910 [Candidatus Micrarchaeota archaeon]|nr:hypothetical protein [Candidatus Micrarchaeota archaeon]
MVCIEGGLDWLYSLSLLSLGMTLVVIGVAYALGQLLSNPQFNVWAKTEIFQVFVSFFFVLLVLFLSDSLCHFRYGDLAGLGPAETNPTSTSNPYAYAHPSISADDNVINASGKYLANVAYFINTEMRAARSLYGISEEASRYSRTPCMPAATFCLYGTSGYTVRPYSGLSSWVQILGFSLYTDTASYLTVLIQMALLAFISGGGIMAYLPLAIVLRSLPLMRQLGGGLLAICVALFLIYPALLTMESLFWNPYQMLGDGWSTLADAADSMGRGFTYVTAGAYAETMAAALLLAGALLDIAAIIAVVVAAGFVSAVLMIISAGAVSQWTLTSLHAAIQVSMQASSISFLTATFLLSLNIIAIGASARELGRLLGQEVDLSRLMQVL